MLFPSCQTVKIKWLDEIAFVLTFFLLVNITKFELAGQWASSPTSFIGWQLLFSFLVFISLLLHPRIRNEVKILNRASLFLTLPVSISHTILTATAAIGLSALPVAIYIAVTNVTPGILILITRKHKNFTNPTVLGCIAICVSVVIIFIFDSMKANTLLYIFLLSHVVINLIQSLYLKKVNLQIPDFTLIFYNNIISLIALLPVSTYNATQSQLELQSILPCFITGFLSLALQTFGFRIKAKNNKFLSVQGVAQLFATLLSIYMFEDSMDTWVWCLIGINWFTTGFILNFSDEDSNKNSQFILVVPHVTKNLYVEKYINYNDMA